MEPGPLDALLPQWRQSPPAICVPAKRDEFRFMTRTGSMKLPMPPQLHNHGNFIISLGQLTPWIAQQAEALGVDVFPGFAAAEPLFNADESVAGVRLGDMGIEKDGKPGPNYTPGSRDPGKHHGHRRRRAWQHREAAHSPLRTRRPLLSRRATASG